MSVRTYKDNIHKDTNICDSEKVYFSNGQGCDTIWFKTIKEAREFIEKHGRINGHTAGLCEKCSCHYSYQTKEWKKYPEYSCFEWKEIIKK